MTTWMIGVSTDTAFPAPAGFANVRRVIARLLRPTMTVELSDHLANDIGQQRYEMPLFTACPAPSGRR